MVGQQNLICYCKICQTAQTLLEEPGLNNFSYHFDSTYPIVYEPELIGADSANSIRLETSVSQIKFNVEFPENIYQSMPIVDGDINFAQDYIGEPESPADRPVLLSWQALSSRVAPPQILPPADFDPSQSRLTFADDYFLGVIDLIFPIRTNCARSLDGTRIVISHWPHSPARFSNSLVWFDLKDLRPTELTIPETLITRRVFSPDNRYIAAAGINQNTDKSKLLSS